MRIFKYFLVFTLVSGFLFQSCETTQLEDLVSPNALSPEDASADLLFNQAQLNFLGAMADMQYNGAALGRLQVMSDRIYTMYSIQVLLVLLGRLYILVLCLTFNQWNLKMEMVY